MDGYMKILYLRIIFCDNFFLKLCHKCFHMMQMFSFDANARICVCLLLSYCIKPVNILCFASCAFK